MSWWKKKDVLDEDEDDLVAELRAPSVSRSAASLVVPNSSNSFYANKPKLLLWLDRKDCAFYAEGFPEENCYRLIRTLLDHEFVKKVEELSVVFISNYIKEVPTWCQRHVRPEHIETGHCMLDYHCIILQATAVSEQSVADRLAGKAAVSYVWDLDSTMPFPARLTAYAEHALRIKSVTDLAPRFNRLFRVIPASAFLHNFASDRSHHPRRKDGVWVNSPLPPLPCIAAADGTTMNLHRYWDMSEAEPDKTGAAFGAVISEAEFLASR